MQAGMATAHLFMQSFEMASTWAEKSFREMPSLLLSVAILAASQALGGRMVEAQRTMVLLSQLDPDMRLSSIQEWLPIKRSENFEILTDGLRRAGLGE